MTHEYWSGVVGYRTQVSEFPVQYANDLTSFKDKLITAIVFRFYHSDHCRPAVFFSEKLPL